MNTYIIKNENGEEVDRIVANESFVSANYDYYELDASELIEKAIEWRNSELVGTDILAVLPDYPEAEALLTYRQALRDWTDTEDFPETRPVMGG